MNREIYRGISIAARPEVSGKNVLFPQNDRLYGLKCSAFQTKNALKAGRPRVARGNRKTFDRRPMAMESLTPPQAECGRHFRGIGVLFSEAGRLSGRRCNTRKFHERV